MTEKKFGRTQDLNFREELNNVPLAVYNVCLCRAQSSAHNHHDPCVIVCLLCLYTCDGPAEAHVIHCSGNIVEFFTEILVLGSVLK